MKLWHQKAIELFKAGKRPRHIAEVLNQSGRQVRRVLTANGFDLSGGRLLAHLHYDQHFFKQIDSQAKAYFLGLLAADECLIEGTASNGYRVKLGLVDSELLVEFAHAMGLNSPKLHRKGLNGWEISIASQIMFQDLCSLGVTPRKSLTLNFCDQVPTILQKHYIRANSIFVCGVDLVNSIA